MVIGQEEGGVTIVVIAPPTTGLAAVGHWTAYSCYIVFRFTISLFSNYGNEWQAGKRWQVLGGLAAVVVVVVASGEFVRT